MISTLLKDIKVLDVSSVLAGPSVGMFLAELGADVLKIENATTGGDVTRQWKNPKEEAESTMSAYYLSVNAFKKIQYLDFNNPAAVQFVHRTIAETDIFICNFKKNDAVKFQLDYSTLSKINPSLIYAHITGFGKENSRIAYDLILQAETGFMYLNRKAGQMPNKMPVALIDVLAAHQIKEGILLALYQRIKNNKGAHIHCSLYDAAVCSLVNQATNYLVSDYNPPPMGSLHPNIAPYGEIFETRDKKLITFAIGSDKQFSKLCALLEIPSVAYEEKFSSNTHRVKYRDELYNILHQKIQTFTSAHIYNTCIKEEVPVALIKDVQEVLTHERSQKLIKPVVIGDKTYSIITSIAFEML